MNCRFTLVILFVGFAFLSFAQDFVEIKGQVLREDSLSPINGAVIYNKTSFLGTLSNRNGNFKMRVKVGDTITISHIGFATQALVCQSLDNSEEKIRVVMRIKSYDLPTIDVRRYRLRERYRQAPFSLLRTDNISNPYKLPKDYVENQYYMPSYGGASMPSMGFGIPDFKEMKRREQLEKIAALERIDKKKRYLNYRYSKKLVNELTGLSGNELENFMNYCRPSEKTILESSDYELTYYILQCYEKFRVENE